MLNYEEELKNFRPNLEVEDIENAVYQEEMSDMIEIFKQMTERKK